MMSIASTMTSLHSFGQDDQNSMQHDFLVLLHFGISVAATWCYDTVHGTIAFLWSGHSKRDAM